MPWRVPAKPESTAPSSRASASSARSTTSATTPRQSFASSCSSNNLLSPHQLLPLNLLSLGQPRRGERSEAKPRPLLARPPPPPRRTPECGACARPSTRRSGGGGGTGRGVTGGGGVSRVRAVRVPPASSCAWAARHLALIAAEGLGLASAAAEEQRRQRLAARCVHTRASRRSGMGCKESGTNCADPLTDAGELPAPAARSACLSPSAHQHRIMRGRREHGHARPRRPRSCSGTGRAKSCLVLVENKLGGSHTTGFCLRPPAFTAIP